MYKNITHSLEVADNSMNMLKDYSMTLAPEKTHPLTMHILIFHSNLI